MAQGAPYAVTVQSDPSGQSCTVANGSGTVGSANVTNVSVACVAQGGGSYSIGGTVSGLTGTVVLENNGGNSLSVSANGTFTFSSLVAQGAPYAVTVQSDPSGQSCTVANGSGTVGSANVTNVSVTCVAEASGTVSDNFTRANGSLGANWTNMSVGGLTISNDAVVGTQASGNSGDIYTGAAFGSDQFSQIELTSTQLSGGQWVGPAVRAQSGGQDLYTGIYNWNGGYPELMLFKLINGGWTELGSAYPTAALPAGTLLNLSVTGSTLTFSQNGAVEITATDTSLTGGAPAIMAYGTPTAGNWAGGDATASGTYSIGGTVSGLTGTVVLENNGGNSLSVSANGTFTFGSLVAQGAPYAVTVQSDPSGQSCTVANGSGTVGSANVTNVSVACVAQGGGSYSIGGTVSGLTGTVVLENNGGNSLSVSANGTFTFSSLVAQSAPYAVTVQSDPSGQVLHRRQRIRDRGFGQRHQRLRHLCRRGESGTVSDDFNRANGSLGADWTDMSVGGLTISNDAVVGTQATGNSGDIYTGEAFGSDQFSQIELTSTQLSGGQWVGPAVRAQSGGQDLYIGIYLLNGGSPELMLFKLLNGNWTQLGSAYPTGPLAAGTLLNLTVTGSTLSFSENGAVEITATDTSLTGGAPAIMAYGTPTAGNWVGGDGTYSVGGTYSIGGTVSGLSGTVVLENNGGNNLSVSANGTFTFSSLVDQSAPYDVTVQSDPSGQACTVANGSGTVASANVTNVSVTCGSGVFSPQYVSTDANNIQSYSFTSADDGDGPQTLRVLVPTHPAAGVAHNFLYVLPVEAGLGSVFGDGLETLAALDAEDQYNLTIIEPTFAIDPWYANNPNDANLQYETFMTQDLVPWVKANLATTGSEQNWLIGFSKSGIGGQDLILKHPDLFQLAASWDFPADMSSYDELGPDPAANYGTDANFQANYRLTAAFVNAHKAPFLTNNRIWIGGYYYYQTDVADYDALLTSEGIVHTDGPSQQMAHNWGSGWVPEALAALYQDSTQLSSANATDDYSFNAAGGSPAPPASGSGLDGTTITLPATLRLPGPHLHRVERRHDHLSAPGPPTPSRAPARPSSSPPSGAPTPPTPTAYAAGGGTGNAPASGSGLDGTTITLPADTFAYPGHTFTGWSDGTLSYPAGRHLHPLERRRGHRLHRPVDAPTPPTPTASRRAGAPAPPASGSGLDGTTVTLPANTFA